MLREKRRIAFFGGSFDPVHSGHLQMAQAAAEQLRLHRVYFVPAAQNPLKDAAPQATPSHRLEMLRTAIHTERLFSIWEGELGRDGPSYTLQSIEHLERVYPNSHLFWIIGSDQLPGLKYWRGIEKLVHKIGFILVMRPGYQLDWPGIPGLSLFLVNNRLNPVSATEVRTRAGAGLPIEGLVPPAVDSYIRENRLYNAD
ncbi:nicotinate (nicotinamide) nucleotide adenylyltransferase [Puniceicoccales bacterium CK1056]|uniref:Probable nicotinate-nucleotide adenylyltransferase n=1 Tax=Oceanipulchritudo coccoides TaxID=2706888 RepID=A0A6B2LZ69_9BACT|nr:nicotinate (nicotinamide) nucleotide adenylyltransferase [Oceanipulchritudo coccoides]NDV61067.1 nicotinate (nicotinamide) nucleotide adenylyltransferase [Oceanipulchritudo coccoides]